MTEATPSPDRRSRARNASPVKSPLAFRMPGTPEDSAAWHERVIAAAGVAVAAQEWQATSAPVRLQVFAGFPRPDSHYGTGRNAQRVKPNSPKHHTQKPGLGDLAQGITSALTKAGVCSVEQVISVEAVKEFVSEPRADIIVTPVT